MRFLSLKCHFSHSWEIHCMGVRKVERRKGLGRALLSYVEDWAIEQGARWLQVKTLSESHASPEYAETRAFYSRMGYEPIQEFPTLWSPANPCLLMARVVNTSSV